jgi:OmpA-OmpF porin, OOP family
MRRRGVLTLYLTLPLPLISAGVLATRPAAAGECSGVASPCINDDTLWPHPGASRFVAIGSAETIAAGQVGFGLVTSYLSRPIVLAVPTPGPPGTKEYAIDDQVNGSFLYSYGVSSRLELGLVLPVTFGQGGTGVAPLTGGLGLRDTAVRDVRFGFTYAILPLARPAEGFGLAGRFEVSAPTGDHDQFAGDRSGVFAPSVAADYRGGRAFAGIELGTRLRPTTELLGARIGTQLLAAIGFGFDILPRDKLSLSAEGWALPGLVQQRDLLSGEPPGVFVSNANGNGRYISPAEWQLAVRTAPLRSTDLSFQASGGGAIPLDGGTPVTTPRFRFTLGVRWAPGSATGGATTP